jgi:hypothetical protein
MLRVKRNLLTCSNKATECMDVYITFPTITMIIWNQWLLSYCFGTGFLKWSLCCLVLWVCNKFWVFLHLQFEVLFSCPLAECSTLQCKLIQGTSVWIYNNYTPYESVKNTPSNIFWVCMNALLKLFSFLLILGTHLIYIKYYTM